MADRCLLAVLCPLLLLLAVSQPALSLLVGDKPLGPWLVRLYLLDQPGKLYILSWSYSVSSSVGIAAWDAACPSLSRATISSCCLLAWARRAIMPKKQATPTIPAPIVACVSEKPPARRAIQADITQIIVMVPIRCLTPFLHCSEVSTPPEAFHQNSLSRLCAHPDGERCRLLHQVGQRLQLCPALLLD